MQEVFHSVDYLGGFMRLSFFPDKSYHIETRIGF